MVHKIKKNIALLAKKKAVEQRAYIASLAEK